MKQEGAVEVATTLWNLFNERRWDEARKLLSDEFEAYWPQSNEKFHTPGKFIQLNREYPGTHKIELIDHHHDFARWELVAHVTTETFNERAVVLEQVRTLLKTPPQTSDNSTLELPYRTAVFWCERVGS